MATTLLFLRTRQQFSCNCLVRNFQRTNPNNLFSQSTFKKFGGDFFDSLSTSTISTSTRNGIPFSIRQRIIRKPSVIIPSRLYISSNKSCLKNLSSLRMKTTDLRRIESQLLRNTRTILFGSNGSFHSTPVRQVSPVLWMVIKPVAKLIALFGGRRFRFWYKSLPNEKKKSVLHWQKILLAMAVLSMTGTFYYISHLQETPITKRLRFIAFTEDQFMKIANFEAKLQEKMSENSFLPATHPSYTRVIEIMERLVRANRTLSHMKTQKWKLAIVDSSDINAFVLPTGHIYLHVGLLNFVQNDDQLAIVLAHEVSHALLGHAAEKVSFAQIVDYFVIVVMAAIWAFMPVDGIALVTQAFYEKVVEILLDNPYSRKLEREADIVGLELAAKACFDVREGSNFWKLMQFTEELEGTKTPEWLSTHPSHVKRQELFDFLIPKAIHIREQCRCYPLNREDPRDCLKNMEKMVKNTLAARMARQNLQKLHADTP